MGSITISTQTRTYAISGAVVGLIIAIALNFVNSHPANWLLISFGCSLGIVVATRSRELAVGMALGAVAAGFVAIVIVGMNNQNARIDNLSNIHRAIVYGSGGAFLTALEVALRYWRRRKKN